MVSKKTESNDDVIRYGRIVISKSRLKKLIKDQRNATGKSLRDVALEADVSPTTVNKLEHGDHRVQLDSFLKVLSVLDLLPENVFEIDGETKAPPPTSIEKKIAKWSNSKDVTKILEELTEMLRELSDDK